MNKKVGIILIGYKDYVNRFLDECRDSLRAQNYPRELYQVYIIDNCSINDCEYVKRNYPESRCVARPDGNYAAANNLGIKMAAEDGCEYFVIANMDTKFDPDWLLELVKAMENNPEAGIAQSKILLYPKNEEEKKHPKINTLGNLIHFLGFGITSHYNEPDKSCLQTSPYPSPSQGEGKIYKEREEYPKIKGYASGCSFIIKKEAIDKIGGYNEDYWMYHDDIEMSWKVKLAGYKIVLAPKSIMYHKYEFSRSIMMLYYIERNRYITIFSFYRLPTILLILPVLILMDLGMLFYSMFNGYFRTKLKIYGYFLKPSSWSKIFKLRSAIKKLRVKKDKEIVKGFTGKVLSQEISNPILKYVVNPMFNFYWSVIKKMIVW